MPGTRPGMTESVAQIIYEPASEARSVATTPRDFLTLARTIELPIAHAGQTMASVAAATRKAANEISLPKIARDREGTKSAEERVKTIVAERCSALA